MVSYSAQSVVCECSVVPSDRRALSNIAVDTGVELAAVSMYVADDFVTTMSSAEDLNSPADLQKVLIVLFLYGTLWGSGLLGIFFCSIKQQQSIKVRASTKSDLEEKKRFAMRSKSGEAVRSYLTAYINEIFPVSSNMHTVLRMVY
jgi:hypothetical protein